VILIKSVMTCCSFPGVFDQMTKLDVSVSKS